MSKFAPRIDTQRNRIRTPIPERAHLTKKRVVQRDLVYVIGIPVSIAHESLLEKYEYFGQYGTIKKIVVNSQNIHNQIHQKPTVSAFITYSNVEDARECIYSLENYSHDGSLFKASLGTSKYCTSFLCAQKCTNSDCMYLHDYGNPDDSFDADEIQSNSSRFIEISRPERPPDFFDYPLQDSIKTVFPPRRVPGAPPLKSIPQHHLSDSYDEAYDEEDEESELFKQLHHISPLYALPLCVNYKVGISLVNQLNLNRTSMRTLFERLS